VTSLVVLPEDQASRELMRHIDSVYDERYREHSQSCCVSLAPGYVCKLCRSYEAGRNAALELMRKIVAVEPVVQNGSAGGRCMYCQAELNAGRSGPNGGHKASCPWQSVRLALESPNGRGRRRRT
jgi:hypothetical protein